MLEDFLAPPFHKPDILELPIAVAGRMLRDLHQPESTYNIQGTMPGVLKGRGTLSCFPKVYNPLQWQLTIQGQGPGNEHLCL